MKRIMMNKYGFERWPEEDFSDDGNRFTCYRVGTRVRVSKLVADGQAYISARIDGIKLPYEVYSELPHYKDLDRLNGVSCDSLTDEDLVKLFKDCLLYAKEYKAAEDNIVMPTIAEIEAKCKCWQAKIKNDIKTIENAMSAKLPTLLTNLSKYEFGTLKDYYCNLKKEYDKYDPKTYAAYIANSFISISFCKNEPTNSYYYERLLDMIYKA